MEIKEFFVEGQDSSASHVLIHIAEPVSSSDKERGYFFVVAEITNAYEEQIEHLQQLIQSIEEQHYGGPKFRTLESILQDINKQGHHILEYQGTRIHCAVGTLNRQTLHLGYHGSPRAVLFYPSQDSLHFTRIIEEKEYKESNQLFSEIIEGNINPGDYLLLCTPAVTEFFPHDRVRKILDSRNTRQSVAHIQKVLDELNDKYSFGGVVMHLTDKDDTPRTGKVPKQITGGSEDSLNKFLASTKTTEDTISPLLFKHLKSRVKDALRKTKSEHQTSAPTEHNQKEEPKRLQTQYRIETNFRKNKEGNKSPWSNKMLIILGQTLVFAGKGIYSVGHRLAKGAVEIFRMLYILAANPEGRRTQKIDEWRSALLRRKKYIQELPLSSKIILTVTLALGLLFLGSLIFLKFKENKEAKTQEYGMLIQALKDKKDAAEAALIYEEKHKAFELIAEAKKLIEELQPQNKKQKQEIEVRKAELNALMNKLQNVVMVEPEPIAELSQTQEGSLPSSLLKINNTLVVMFPEEQALRLVHSATKEINEKKYDTAKQLSFGAVSREQDRAVLFNTNGSLAVFDSASGALAAKEIAFPGTEIEIKDAELYNRKLYTLDKKQGQIYKHNETQVGYDKGTPWIKEKTSDLVDSISIAIDGNIYVLSSSSSISKFLSGKEEAFKITGMDPVLSQATRIFTNSDTAHLYVLEPKEKRIIMLNKNGTFVKQFKAEKLSNPKDIFVDETQKLIYVLDERGVYTFGI